MGKGIHTDSTGGEQLGGRERGDWPRPMMPASGGERALRESRRAQLKRRGEASGVIFRGCGDFTMERHGHGRRHMATMDRMIPRDA